MPTKRQRSIRRNGHGGATGPDAPVLAASPMEKVHVWVRLCEEYPDWYFRFWRNHPRALRLQLFADAAEEREAALHQLDLTHNGWCDPEGVLFPPMETDAFWNAVPDEVAIAVLQRIREESLTLPNSLRATRQT